MNAAVTRSVANCWGGNSFNPCLMRINEVPQIKERAISKTMALKLLLSGITGAAENFYILASNFIEYLVDLRGLHGFDKSGPEDLEIGKSLEVARVMSSHFEHTQFIAFPTYAKVEMLSGNTHTFHKIGRSLV